MLNHWAEKMHQQLCTHPPLLPVVGACKISIRCSSFPLEDAVFTWRKCTLLINITCKLFPVHLVPVSVHAVWSQFVLSLYFSKPNRWPHYSCSTESSSTHSNNKRQKVFFSSRYSLKYVLLRNSLKIQGPVLPSFFSVTPLSAVESFLIYSGVNEKKIGMFLRKEWIGYSSPTSKL